MTPNRQGAGVPSDTPASGKPRRYVLDNAAKLYPSVATKDWSSVYRVSVTPREAIDPAALQVAASGVLPRFLPWP